jgi:hypothetical protein
MDSLRQKQIDEVLQYDKVINSRVFGREIDQVAQFNDPRSRPTKDDITFQAEVEKRVQEIITIIQKMTNNITSNEETALPFNQPAEDAGDGGDGEEGGSRNMFNKMIRRRKIGGANEVAKTLTGLEANRSLRDTINTTDNLTADILNKYNSLIEYILQYKRYTIYGNQSVQDAQFTADKIKSLLGPLKSLLVRIQSSNNNELFSKVYNVLNKIIEAIEVAPPYQKIDVDEMNKETLPQDVSQLPKYGVALGTKLQTIENKLRNARDFVPLSDRDRAGQEELIKQLERQKQQLLENWNLLESDEIQHALELHQQLENEDLDDEQRAEIKRAIDMSVRSARPDTRTRRMREKPTILKDVLGEQERAQEAELTTKEQEYQDAYQQLSNLIKDREDTINRALAIKQEIAKLTQAIANRNASIKPTTSTSQKKRIKSKNREDNERIATLQADADNIDDAEIDELRADNQADEQERARLTEEYNIATSGKGKRTKKKGGRKFIPQYAPEVENYDDEDYGDTNQNDNLDDLEDNYIVDEDDIKVGGMMGRPQSKIRDIKDLPIPEVIRQLNARREGLARQVAEVARDIRAENPQVNQQGFIRGLRERFQAIQPAVVDFVVQMGPAIFRGIGDLLQMIAGSKSKKVCMPKKTYLEEHHHLIGLLDDASGKLKKEANKQAKELKDEKKKGGASSNIQKGMYPRGKPGPSTEDNEKAYNMAMAIDKASRRKIQLGKEEVKALKPVLPLGGIPQLSASGAGRVTKGEDFGALLAKLKDGKKSRELKKAHKTMKVSGGALSFNDKDNDMFD